MVKRRRLFFLERVYSVFLQAGAIAASRKGAHEGRPYQGRDGGDEILRLRCASLRMKCGGCCVKW